MSQLLRYVGEAPVGAGISALSGNGGFPGDTAVADGNNNVNIVGFGTINVAQTGANTLTITSTGVPARYPTDDGTAVPNVLGEVSILGDANINTDAILVNEVHINLNSNVHIPGDFIADGNITAIGQGSFEAVTTTANGLNITGLITAHSIGFGVVQVDGFRNMFASSGTANGQVLISDIAGFPAWRQLHQGHGIVITNGANYIDISANPALPTLFSEDVGLASATGAPIGVMYIHGDGVNTHTTGDGAKTISVELRPNIIVDSVTTTGLLDPGIITAIGSSIQSGGNVTAAQNITAGNNLGVTNLTSTGNLYVTTATTLNAQRNGVLQTDAVGLITATNGNPNGTNGQVLISGPVAPAWNALTSAGGTVTITNPGDNQINLESAGSSGSTISSFFARQLGDTLPVTGDHTGNYIWLGAPAILTTAPNDCFNTGGNLTLGDGVGTSAKYIAPATGTYFFNFQVALFSPSVITFASCCINNITQNITYYSSVYNNAGTTGGIYTAQTSYSSYIKLNAGDQVQFGVNHKGGIGHPTDTSIASSFVVANNIQSFTADTFISGFKVA